MASAAYNNKNTDDRFPFGDSDKKRSPSFEYRPLIGFLSETIDDCLSREAKIRTSSGIDSEIASERLRENREKMFRAMRTLENTVQLVVSEMEARSQEEFDKVSEHSREEELFWLQRVFPEDQAGQKLLRNYRELRLRR